MIKYTHRHIQMSTLRTLYIYIRAYTYVDTQVHTGKYSLIYSLETYKRHTYACTYVHLYRHTVTLGASKGYTYGFTLSRHRMRQTHSLILKQAYTILLTHLQICSIKHCKIQNSSWDGDWGTRGGRGRGRDRSRVCCRGLTTIVSISI